MTAQGKPAARLDPVIHPITRLSICGLLASGADWVEFAALRDAAGISDSVLSKQSRLLEDAGYVDVRKGAVGRRPRTWFRLTPTGRAAFQAHIAWLQQAALLSPQDAADDRTAPARSVHATPDGDAMRAEHAETEREGYRSLRR
ncbi:MAG TPA: transcriptional regulator [Cellulomonas sp.]